MYLIVFFLVAMQVLCDGPSSAPHQFFKNDRPMKIRSSEQPPPSEGTIYPSSYLKNLRTQPDVFESMGYTPEEGLADSIDAAIRMIPNIGKRVVIGESLTGKPIQAIQFSWPDGTAPLPGRDEMVRPNVVLAAGLAGNEALGREMLIVLIHRLASLFVGKRDGEGGRTGRDPGVKALFQTTNLTIIPSMNPDGYNFAVRENLQFVDLNRDWPPHEGVSVFPNATGLFTPEARSMAEWFATQPHFDAAVSFHGGDMLVNYPLDAGAGGETGHHAGTPDEFLLRTLAEEVSYLMGCPRRAQEERPGEACATNGQAFYRAVGTFQDWQYWQGANALSVEIGAAWPTLAEGMEIIAPAITGAMRFAIMQQQSVAGRIVDAQTLRPIEGASVHVENYRPVRSNPQGEFLRFLTPRGYENVRVTAPGYQDWVAPIALSVYPDAQTFIQPQLQKL